MSAAELPDDSRQWPDDPFALLGVERGTSEMEIKRAYTRLIRRFKPEHRPDEFRRIREAYEACLAQGRWFFPTTQFPAPVFAQEEVRKPESTTEPESSDEPEVVEHPLPTPRIDEVDRLWKLAEGGQIEEAYWGLHHQADLKLERSDLPLRLYWLLALNPAIDAARTRHDWLAAALVRSRLNGSAVELYRRELGINPDAALYGPYLQLLSADANPQDLLAVGRMRLFAAGRSHSWSPADADLKVLARRIPLVNEPAWLAFLVSAFDWTAWERPFPFYSHVSEELNRLRHMELTHGDSFDRVEETERHAKDWTDAADDLLSAMWVRLVPIAWANYGDLAFGDLKPALEDVVADSALALRRFDRFLRIRGSAVLVLLARSMERTLRSRGSDTAEFPEDLIRTLAARLPDGWHRGYSRYREELLGFLTGHSIHPLEFAEACQLHPDVRVRDIATQMQEDLSLRLVWLACTLNV